MNNLSTNAKVRRKVLNARLKILFIAGWYPTKEKLVNGIFVKEHAKAVSLYNDVVVLHARMVDTPVKGLYEVTDEAENGIQTIQIKYGRPLIHKTALFIHVWSIFAAFRKLLKEGWRPDIIHAHINTAGVPAVIIAKKYRIPTVITEHSSNFLLHKLTRLGTLRAKFVMNRSDFILPVSKALEMGIKSYGIKNQFEVVPNVVDTKMFYPPSNKKRNDKKKMLFVGLLKPVKGIPFLLKALAQLKEKRQDFILDIVGDGSNRKEYEQLTEELGLGRMVEFHGFKTKEEVSAFMRKCDFFVQPSLYETFGVTYIEAMACGKPIVATQLSALEEKINEDRGILVRPKDADTLAKAIDSMLDHYQNYSPEKISQYVKDNFGYKLVGKKLDDIYRKVLGENL